MNFTKTFAAAVSIALTTGINVSALAATATPNNSDRQHSNPITETNQPQQECPVWMCG
ncbi:MAG TPA: protochlorophyllide oxidoreductase [Cyanothece sp. UBA12306]|nr:protochlorophyllide oxidoreductase [Cyanothece sp. UBA12306]